MQDQAYPGSGYLVARRLAARAARAWWRGTRVALGLGFGALVTLVYAVLMAAPIYLLLDALKADLTHGFWRWAPLVLTYPIALTFAAGGAIALAQETLEEGE